MWCCHPGELDGVGILVLESVGPAELLLVGVVAAVVVVVVVAAAAEAAAAAGAEVGAV